MTIEQLKTFLLEENQPDQWWVAVENRIKDHKYGIDEIVAQFSDKKVAVLHSSNDDHDQPVWIPVDWKKVTPGEALEAEQAYLNGLTPTLKRQFEKVEDEISDMRGDMENILDFMKNLDGMIRDRQLIRQKLQDIEKREQFLEASESKLMAKIHDIEEREEQLKHHEEVKAKKTEQVLKFKAV